MIAEAFKLSAGKSNPSAYVNAVLSSWKSDGVFAVEKIPVQRKDKNSSALKTRDYTKEEIDALIDDIDDIDF